MLCLVHAGPKFWVRTLFGNCNMFSPNPMPLHHPPLRVLLTAIGLKTAPASPGRVADIPGATVEHNKFCVSVHFRNCQPDQLDDVVAAVEAILDAHADLRATRGRKVLEIRPQVPLSVGWRFQIVSCNACFLSWDLVVCLAVCYVAHAVS